MIVHRIKRKKEIGERKREERRGEESRGEERRGEGERASISKKNLF